MIDTFRQLIANQFEAAFCTLHACVSRCPDAEWNARVFEHRLCQVVFHTLLFADCYLGESEEAVRQQAFHREHADVFRDYEEFEDRAPLLLYDKAWIEVYLQYCRTKARATVAAETVATLEARTGFPGRTFSRAELHVYNIRHVQHHAAQLSLRLKIDCRQDVPWVGSGWRDI